jgi:hypothetical protein
MEFSYRIDEVEYRQALKLRRKSAFAKLSKFTLVHILFWVIVLLLLMLLWIIVQHTTPHPPVIHHAASATAPLKLLPLIWPLCLILAVGVFLMFGLRPSRASRMLRQDPSMLGEFTVTIKPDSISIQNTAGSSSQSSWNLFDYWREGKGILVLAYKTGAYSPLSLANLSEPERAELRTILGSVLPKK